MDNYSNHSKQRENFLLSLLNKVTKEYKALLEFTRRNKPFKIAEILELSHIPGETRFAVQLSNKNCVVQLTAAEIISQKYDLNDFNDFHADMIRQAAQGKLIAFLKLSENAPSCKITEKIFDKNIQQYIFVIETKEQIRFTRTADELSKDKNLLNHMGISDIYDVGFTQGCESVLKEKAALLLARNKS